ncbi:enoyl-CoA hydratase-related protein [Natronolimnohabitans sp. A-GB9]|uniref:enoyl-CoA hydratase/isomerase family protein n=1 Tax=Natronolimnohabitans sp. A-GB9 TaxID=3069757 RepID=UPI0027B2FE1A|nr:enoyl-CoA hydratase-related protein [Natronolimnohabitans sp. A-GB9]MDQ2050869.1 enoyl-CoA hydratase-related protein [Natronolimnohabitans sp. A-GB9]
MTDGNVGPDEDETPVRVEHPREHVARVTLDRPDAMNAYDEPLLRTLVSSLEDLDADDDVRAIVLTGAGERAFCSGVDLENMPLTPDMDFSDYEAGLGLFQNVVRTLRTIETPVVAAINGYALGAGCDTALACDFRIASENATIGETFIDVGFVPGDGGAYLLPRLIGEARAKELIFTGRHLEGEEIVEWDLARECVTADELLEAAESFAAEIAAQPPVALGLSKSLVNESADVDLETAFEHATRAQRICSQTDDHTEAVEAFAEDREPEFTGE